MIGTSRKRGIQLSVKQKMKVGFYTSFISLALVLFCLFPFAMNASTATIATTAGRERKKNGNDREENGGKWRQGKKLGNYEEDGKGVSQIHMAQGVDSSSMTISWMTENSQTASTVLYGLHPSSLSLKATSGEAPESYSFSNGGVNPDYQSGYFHHVTLPDLKPKTTYFYQLGDFFIGNVSGILSFRTLPESGDTSTQINFSVIGDLGQTEDSQITMQHTLEEYDSHMILHAGDFSYADCEQARWDSYMNIMQPLSQERPWMGCPGNHEIELEQPSPKVFTAYEKRFRFPAIKPAEFGYIPELNPYWCASSAYVCEYNYGNSFYSLNVGQAHIISLNSYSYSNLSSPQYQWLEKDLQSVDRKETVWIIVMMHCPWYNSNTAHYIEFQTVEMRDSMEALFYKYNVNVVFAGHVHAYERSYPVYQNTTTTNGPIYINIGDGGNREGHANEFQPGPKPVWSAFRNGTQYGHGRLMMKDTSSLKWEWHRNVDGERVVMDTVEIFNTHYHKSAYKNNF